MTDIQLPVLNLPPCELSLQCDAAGEILIHDKLRRKWVKLTPEEHVRQSFVSWLNSDLGYPAGMTAVEVGMRLNNTIKRSDIVVYDRQRKPMVIVECKAPHVALTQDVFDQVVRYNMVLRAKLLIVTNGLQHYAVAVDYQSGKCKFLETIPSYAQLQADL